MSSARFKLDGSDCYLNCCYLNPIVLRWMTRSAYNISGSECEDVCLGLFCSCCVINQTLQTTKNKGKPFPNVGPGANHQSYLKDDPEYCCHCLYACCCTPCAVATSVNRAMHMPCWMAFCCSNYCISRSMLRYHYRIEGEDLEEDCLYPLCAMMAINSVVLSPLGCLYFTNHTMDMLKETKHRGFTGNYLSPDLKLSFNPTQALAMTVSAPMAMASPVLSYATTTTVPTQPNPSPYQQTMGAQAQAPQFSASPPSMQQPQMPTSPSPYQTPAAILSQSQIQLQPQSSPLNAVQPAGPDAAAPPTTYTMTTQPSNAVPYPSGKA